MKKALLVIDVQNYFVTEKAVGLPQKIAWYIEAEQDSYDAVLFIKFRNDPASNFHTLLDFKEVTKAPATDIHPDLASFATQENTFEKTTYSAMKSEALMQYLTANDIKALDLCGISLDACVLATAFEAFDLGYYVEVLDNLCSVSTARDGLMESAQMIIQRDLRKREDRFVRE